MKTLGELLSTPDAFRAWLQAQKPGTLVGERGEPWDCPVARFLQHSGLENPDVIVPFTYGGPHSDRQKFELPPVLVNFTLAVDKGGSQRIRAKTALALLDRAESEAS